jgi:hypothetical protein
MQKLITPLEFNTEYEIEGFPYGWLQFVISGSVEINIEVKTSGSSDWASLRSGATAITETGVYRLGIADDDFGALAFSYFRLTKTGAGTVTSARAQLYAPTKPAAGWNK